MLVGRGVRVGCLVGVGVGVTFGSDQMKSDVVGVLAGRGVRVGFLVGV